MKSDIVNAEVLSRISAFEIVKYADNASEGIMDLMFARVKDRCCNTNRYYPDVLAIIEANFVARGYDVTFGKNEFGTGYLIINW